MYSLCVYSGRCHEASLISEKCGAAKALGCSVGVVSSENAEKEQVCQGLPLQGVKDLLQCAFESGDDHNTNGEQVFSASYM